MDKLNFLFSVNIHYLKSVYNIILKNMQEKFQILLIKLFWTRFFHAEWKRRTNFI